MPYTDEQNEYLVDTYKTTRNTKLTLDSFKDKYDIRPSKDHLYDLLEERGIKRNPKGGNRRGLSPNQLRDLVDYFDRDAVAIAEMTGLTPTNLIAFTPENLKLLNRKYPLNLRNLKNLEKIPKKSPSKLEKTRAKYANVFDLD